MSARVLLRAASGPEVGMGHAIRTRSVAEAVVAEGGSPLVIVDDARTARALEGDGLEACAERELPGWAARDASGAWIDGFRDWSAELGRLAGRGVRTLLVEPRAPAREAADEIVYPALHWQPDAWDERHAERVYGGAAWIPLPRDLVELPRRLERDVDLLVTFGGSDPERLTERVLAALDATDRRIVVSIGHHMQDRRGAVCALAESLACAGEGAVHVLRPGAQLARWMARARAAITAVGTTLYELAYLETPALVLANWESDRAALGWYEMHGPHLPLGIAAEMSEEGLRAAIAGGLGELASRPTSAIPELGGGARRLARRLLGRAA